MEKVKKSKFSSGNISENIEKALFISLLTISAVLMALALLSCSSDNGDPSTPMQTGTGTVEGSVKDESGGLYPGALIRLTKASEESSRVTNSNGVYTITSKSTGSHSIEMIPPLASEVISANPAAVNIQANATATVDFRIQIQPLEAHLNFGDVQLIEEIVDGNGNTPTDANEPLFAANIFDAPLGQLNAIMAPDGHQVTLSEFKQAKGTLNVNCNGDSSTIAVALEGLIPNGTYTFWLAYLNRKVKVREQIDFMNDFVNLSNPPVGKSDGTENVAIAGADGKINVTLQHGSCILTDEVALVIPVLYHLNGKTFGGGHVPDAEEMAHLLVYFQ